MANDAGTACAIGCAAASVLDLSIMWTVVTVAALAAFGAAYEWEYTQPLLAA